MMAIAMHRLLAISSVSLLFCQLSYASVLLDGRHTSGLGFANIQDRTGFGALEPRAGYEAFVGLQPPPTLSLSRRDCLPNGSNYCFGNNVNFCTDCGTCCVKGLYCCEKGATCCGMGCCASGHSCSKNGKCLAPVVLNRNAVTAVSTIYETSTYTNQKTATVFVVEVETSTILSTVETTISTAATQTNVHWVTVTVTAAPSPQATFVRRADGDGKAISPDTKRLLLDSLVLRGVELFRNEAVLYQRQAVSVSGASPASTVGVSTVATPSPAVPSVATRAAAIPTTTAPTLAAPTKAAPFAAASTVMKLTTQITTVTEVDVKSVTVTSTSYVMTTVYETVTKVLNALTTIDVTSTLTVTSRPPITKVITTTVDPVIPATASAAPTASSNASGGSSQSLSTPAIIGVAVGSAVGFILIVILIFFIRRWRMREAALDTSPPSTPDHMLFHQPTLPKLPKLYPHSRFQPSAPAHHATAAYLPPGYPSPTPSQAFAYGHERSSSGFSTLIGKPGDRRSGFSTTSGHTFEKLPPVRVVSPFEVPDTQERNWSEADGKSLTVVTTTEAVPRPSSPFPSLCPSPLLPQPHNMQAASFSASQSPSQILDRAITAHATRPLTAVAELDADGDGIRNGNGSWNSPPAGRYEHQQQMRPQTREYRGREFAPQQHLQAPPSPRKQQEEARHGENRGCDDAGQQEQQPQEQNMGQNLGQGQQQPQQDEEARDARHDEQSDSSQQQQQHQHQENDHHQQQQQQPQSQGQDLDQSQEQAEDQGGQPQQQKRQRDERRYARQWYIDSSQLEQFQETLEQQQRLD